MEIEFIKSIPSAYFLFVGNEEGISVWLNLALVTCIYQASDAVTCKVLDGTTHRFNGDGAKQIIEEIQAIKSRRLTALI